MASSSSSTESTIGVSSTTQSDPSQSIGSPYYLHPNENPSLILVSPILTGPNFHSWARAMKMALMSKNKVRFIDRSIAVPATSDPLFPAWERCNMMVLSWLTRSISTSIAQSILWIDKASDVWEDLHARFSQSDVFRLADLQEDIQGLKQGDLTIMLIDPLPTINRVFALVQQQERELGYPVSDVNALLAKSFVPRAPTSGLPKPHYPASGKQCTYCGKGKHIEATCYRKHGFPPGFKFRNSNVNSVSSNDAPGKSLTESIRVANQTYSFTQEQYQKLLALVQPDTSSSLPNVSVNKVSTNELTMPHSAPVFKEDDWFS
ncbi:hypothetical protein QN277_006213 [Acacia crassicarpa]|uniref:Retrotransposon Copia-like N-terminal domain-containing protein n=1 Tax=Acacia crassicarpa TaxID=499986 RepID=A0AAE1IZK0_9FABA|nr:hypothetical protein QN277_006213 [Acacia crassicarpa]